MRLSKRGFTFIEMVFVLVILGIIAKFGVEFLAQSYRTYLYETINDKLSNTSTTAAEFIAKRLQYRIRPSVIVRKGSDLSDFHSLENFVPTNPEEYTVLEWIGYDIEGFRGDRNADPLWTGIIDKNESYVSKNISTPSSKLDDEDDLIQALSSENDSIDDAALYLFSAANDIRNGFGWNGRINDQNLSFAMHPVKKLDTTTFSSGATVDFTALFKDIEEKGKWDARYYLAWSAYAVRLEDGVLKFYYDYQPWNGESFEDDAKEVTLMRNVDTFKMIQKQGVIKIQVCTTNQNLNGSGSMNIGKFALCKEKTIY